MLELLSVDGAAVRLLLVVALGCMAVSGLLLAVRRRRHSRDERLARRRQARLRGQLLAGSVERPLRLALVSVAASEALVRVLDGLSPSQRAALQPRWREATAAAWAARRLVRRLGSRRAAVRGHAVVLCGRLRCDETPLYPLLCDGDLDVRRAAVEAIARHERPRSVEPLLGVIADGRLAAERVVEWLGSPWAAGRLARAYWMASYRALRPWLCEALGLAGEPGPASAPLDAALRSCVVDERVRACRAVGRLGLVAHATTLRRLLCDEHWAVRAQAARALGELGIGAAAGELAPLLSDRAFWVRCNAAEALRRVGPPGLAELQRLATAGGDRFARERAAEALAAQSLESGAGL